MVMCRKGLDNHRATKYAFAFQLKRSCKLVEMEMDELVAHLAILLINVPIEKCIVLQSRHSELLALVIGVKP
jgi:hypothetical protein